MHLERPSPVSSARGVSNALAEEGQGCAPESAGSRCCSSSHDGLLMPGVQCAA
jgi:hypothetical protein